MSRYRLNFSLASILTLSRSGIKSRRADFLMSLVFWGIALVDSMAGSGAGAGSAVGVGSRVGSGIGSGAEVAKSGISTGATGVTGSGAGASTLGSGNGPTGSPSSPVSPSGIEDGAATGSENTGSMLVVLVISSIAFCRSLSTLGVVTSAGLVI